MNLLCAFDSLIMNDILHRGASQHIWINNATNSNFNSLAFFEKQNKAALCCFCHNFGNIFLGNDSIFVWNRKKKKTDDKKSENK